MADDRVLEISGQDLREAEPERAADVIKVSKGTNKQDSYYRPSGKASCWLIHRSSLNRQASLHRLCLCVCTNAADAVLVASVCICVQVWVGLHLHMDKPKQNKKKSQFWPI